MVMAPLDRARGDIVVCDVDRQSMTARRKPYRCVIIGVLDSEPRWRLPYGSKKGDVCAILFVLGAGGAVVQGVPSRVDASGEVRLCV